MSPHVTVNNITIFTGLVKTLNYQAFDRPKLLYLFYQAFGCSYSKLGNNNQNMEVLKNDTLTLLYLV